MNKYYIYCIENIENHKTYIRKHKGDSSDLDDHYMGSEKLIKNMELKNLKKQFFLKIIVI